MLSKKTAVLDLIPESCDIEGVYFAQPDMESESVAVALSWEAFADFGRPTQITVCVQPGDLLNTEEQCDDCDCR